MAITDKARGALKTLAAQEGYPTFVIPDDVGGRFSVLTPVGLLPLAVAGVDIAALVRGAQEMEKTSAEGVAFKENPANRVRSPSWIYWPIECRSAVSVTLAGKMPLPCLPSLSP